MHVYLLCGTVSHLHLLSFLLLPQTIKMSCSNFMISYQVPLLMLIAVGCGPIFKLKSVCLYSLCRPDWRRVESDECGEGGPAGETRGEAEGEDGEAVAPDTHQSSYCQSGGEAEEGRAESEGVRG